MPLTEANSSYSNYITYTEIETIQTFPYSLIKLILLFCLFTEFHTFQTHIFQNCTARLVLPFCCFSLHWVFCSFGFVSSSRAPPSLTGGTGCFIFLLLFLLVVVFPAGFSASLSVAVRVLGLQHVDGGCAGPAGVVGEPSPAAPAGPLRRGLDALRRQRSRKLLRAFLNTKQHRLQQEDREVFSLLVRPDGRTHSTCTLSSFPSFCQLIKGPEIPVKGTPIIEHKYF